MIETLQQKLEERAMSKFRALIRKEIQRVSDLYGEEIYLDVEARKYSISELLNIIKDSIIKQESSIICKKEIETFLETVESCKEQLDSLNQQ